MVLLSAILCNSYVSAETPAGMDNPKPGSNVPSADGVHYPIGRPAFLITMGEVDNQVKSDTIREQIEQRYNVTSDCDYTMNKTKIIAYPKGAFEKENVGKMALIIKTLNQNVSNVPLSDWALGYSSGKRYRGQFASVSFTNSNSGSISYKMHIVSDDIKSDFTLYSKWKKDATAIANGGDTRIKWDSIKTLISQNQDAIDEAWDNFVALWKTPTDAMNWMNSLQDRSKDPDGSLQYLDFLIMVNAKCGNRNTWMLKDYVANHNDNGCEKFIYVCIVAAVDYEQPLDTHTIYTMPGYFAACTNNDRTAFRRFGNCNFYDNNQLQLATSPTGVDSNIVKETEKQIKDLKASRGIRSGMERMWNNAAYQWFSDGGAWQLLGALQARNHLGAYVGGVGYTYYTGPTGTLSL